MLVALTKSDGQLGVESIPFDDLLKAIRKINCDHFITIDEFDKPVKIGEKAYNLTSLMFYQCETVEETEFFQKAMLEVAKWEVLICVGKVFDRTLFNLGETRVSSKNIFDVEERSVDIYLRHFFCASIIETAKDLRMGLIIEDVSSDFYNSENLFVMKVWDSEKNTYITRELRADNFPAIERAFKNFRYEVENYKH